MRKLLLVVLSFLLLAAPAMGAPAFPFGNTPNEMVQAVPMFPVNAGNCASVGFTVLAVEGEAYQGILVVTDDGVALLGLVGHGAWVMRMPDSPEDPWKAIAHFDDTALQGGTVCAAIDYARGVIDRAKPAARTKGTI